MIDTQYFDSFRFYPVHNDIWERRQGHLTRVRVATEPEAQRCILQRTNTLINAADGGRRRLDLHLGGGDCKLSGS